MAVKSGFHLSNLALLGPNLGKGEPLLATKSIHGQGEAILAAKNIHGKGEAFLAAKSIHGQGEAILATKICPEKDQFLA